MAIRENVTPRRSSKSLPLKIMALMLFMFPGLSATLFARETLIQFEGKSSYFFVQPRLHYVDSLYHAEGFLLNSNLYSTRYFSESTSLQFEHRLRGIRPDKLFPEEVLPFDNYMCAGLRAVGEVSTFQAGYSNELFPYAQQSIPPHFLPLKAMLPEMLNAVNGSYNVQNDIVSFDVKSTFFILNYKYKPSDPLAPPPYRESRDADLWTDLKGEIYFLEDFTLGAGWLRKNDLNNYTGYGIDRFWAGLSGEHQLFRRKLMLEWEAGERLLQSAVVKMNEYAVGQATDGSLKLLWRKSSTFFIKGGAQLELAANLHKLYWQAQLRKLSGSNSSFDLGYFATSGVLFPRQGISSAGKFLLASHFGLAPGVEVYFSRFTGESAFRYYRSDLRLEFLFPVINRLEMFAGGGYRHFERHPLFSTRGAVFAGLRSW